MGSDRLRDTSSIDHATAFVILRTTRLLRLFFLRHFQAEGVDISPEQWAILFRLHEHAPQAQTELADRSLNDRANITRLVQGLERKGWVQRTPDPEDGRRILVSLTADGAALMERLLPFAVGLRERAFRDFSEAEAETLHRLLLRLAETLEDA